MKTAENNPEDWYRSAKVRLGSADRLYPLEGSSESVIELLQESASMMNASVSSRTLQMSSQINFGQCIIPAVNLMNKALIFMNCAFAWMHYSNW